MKTVKTSFPNIGINSPFSPIVQRVGDVLASVLPNGTNPRPMIELSFPEESLEENPSLLWKIVPEIPTDLFAACGYLCKLSGIVAFFDPNPHSSSSAAGEFGLNRAERDNIDEIAWRWRGGVRGGRPDHPKSTDTCEPSLVPPEEVQKLWDELLASWDSPTNCGYYIYSEEVAESPTWWKSALSLVIISDLVVEKPFQNPEMRFSNTVMGDVLSTLYWSADEAPLQNHDASKKNSSTVAGNAGAKPDVKPAPRGPASLTFFANSSIACVLPKIRVAGVGATLRNVTRNLALLPGRGEMRCYWDMTDAEPENEDKEALDILLIPAPFRIHATDISTDCDNSLSEKKNVDKPNWENFRLAQNWINSQAQRKEFVSDCTLLLEDAKKETASVNAVVLPEYALDYELFDELCNALKKTAPKLEFVISGSSGNCDNQKANTLLTRVWRKRKNDTYITNSRRKHHRWRIDRNQVDTYGLGTVLNPEVKYWWETTPIGQRELYFHRFRESSTFAALICEELARSDTCHDILRSVGPNLVFALLMDGPQIPGRWSAQYAANLSDDPGCAVLSLTSYGLVERSNRMLDCGSESIALWRDDTGRTVTINMPPGEGARGVLLSLWSEHLNDQTITGKRSLVRAWRYSSHYPVYSTRSSR